MAIQKPYNDLLTRLDNTRLPQHIGIIMDGNGRWAAAAGKARTFGHKAGAEALRRAAEICREIHIPVLTVFAFSTENWRRPPAEIDFLMRLLGQYLQQELSLLQKENIRLNGLGDWSILPAHIRQLYDEAKQATANNSEMTLNLAVNYGARQEIVRAAQRLATATQAGELKVHEIDEEMFAAQLETASQPELDLLIRPAGELRLSNFLLWQAAYAELFFTPLMWPEFSKRDILLAIIDFQTRFRRFGSI
ncbi:MAG: polyprenyl diphosphate synthase [Firmicutes bacterium]|nr:polyprenyl diphosphate synthase [Bacillota bacterium]